YRRVQCQRLFVQGRGSQYFEVRAPLEEEENSPQPVPVDGEAAGVRVGKEMAEAWAVVEKRATTTIQEGEKDEAHSELNVSDGLGQA
ncbi:hypothetical protein BCR34DRAFT_501331, partial [Clohesyomyces aquaticus]